MRQRQKRYGLLDLDTGEVSEAVITPRRSVSGGAWMKVFLDGMSRLALAQIHGQAYRVLVYLLSANSWGNGLPTPAEAATALSLGRTAVARAYAELSAAGAILKRGTRYYLSPTVGWKGTDSQLEAAYRELFTEDRKLLAVAE